MAGVPCPATHVAGYELASCGLGKNGAARRKPRPFREKEIAARIYAVIAACSFIFSAL